MYMQFRMTCSFECAVYTFYALKKLARDIFLYTQNMHNIFILKSCERTEHDLVLLPFISSVQFKAAAEKF